ncbi:MAG: SpaA isopeptide-forming pilin-related protein [Eubacterium coprostanoligenes]|uniref:SpaA isopeptide-forming pilin-related protein n=1 Tax=Eubacterium coprostanoligenes TaxID=290054 RepID=UPI0024097113|nr:SpaA isopeptide-forming pilin-related protein [Eubacterium coprostanoligenes]MDD6665317.1 SpaA isopeptide-forming pilin-related protein [Eubacterium coprostanoligenes]
MKDKFKSLGKRIVALLLSVLTVTMMFPLSAFAATENLGAVSGANKLDISVSKHYGHEVHTTKKSGTTYPLFCIEYGTTSPNSSYLKGKKAMASDNAIKAAKWIFAGYYLEHGNSIDWQDMAYCQKKVWSIFGSNTNWTFSDSGYQTWCDNAKKRMSKLDKKPSFNKTNVGRVLPGGSLIVTDTNKVLCDYPAFTKKGNGWSIIHKKNSNSLTVKVDESCTASSFRVSNGEYYKDGTGDDDELLLYYPYGSESYQKLIYSAYYDPVSMAFSGSITSVGGMKLIKTSEDGVVSGIKFHFTGPKDFSKTFTTDENGEIPLSGLAPGTYTITEESMDRYVPNQSKTITIASNQSTSVAFHNTLKKFRVNVTKQDYEKGHAQGDAKLSGAVYGLYKGEELVAQYTTDSNGSFTTDYFVCGTDWTVREISPSEGYLLNDTVYRVGADPRDYNIEYNTAPDMTVMEQVIKGKISIIKHTDNGDTQIETPEKGAEFQVYLKSSGSFVNADKDERDTIVCDQDGFASTKLLPYGVYTVHQTKGWDGREKITDFDVFINTDGKTYKFLINNKNFESYLKVVKLDKETGKRIPYEGAAFEIYDSNNHRITMQYTYPQVTSIHTFYTNKDGYLITPEKLPYGYYTLKEVQAPYGYVLDDTPIPFVISQENASTDTGVTVVKVKAKDMAQKGVINITKTGEIFSSVEENKGVYTPKYSVGNLKGAVFEIYAAEDITTLDGTVRYEQGALVDTVTTDDDGVAKSKELYLGKYTVIEKTAPNGYVHNGTKYDVELTYAGQNVSVTSNDISVYNDRQKVAVLLKKEMGEDKTFNLGKNNEISFVQFGVYANEDIKSSNGDVIPKDALITFANCDRNGSIVFDCDLPVGFKWYVKEIATDKHYILSDTKYEFDTEYQGQDVKAIDIKVNNDKAIENNLIYGSVKGLKIDRETQEVIKGATFGLFKSDTTEFTKENAILTAVTDENGVFVFDNIPYGEYLIKELKPADGYLDNEDVFTVTIKDNEQVVEVTAINDKVPELKTTATVNDKKEAVAKGKITIKDTVEYKHLVPNNEYVIKGTLMDKSTGKPFKVKGKEITSTVKFVPDKTDGKVEVTFTFDGSAIKKDTKLVVFETLYRDGVELTAHADINDDGQTVTIKVPELENPKTGDERNINKILGIAGASLVGIAGCVYFFIKRKKKGDTDNE